MGKSSYAGTNPSAMSADACPCSTTPTPSSRAPWILAVHGETPYRVLPLCCSLPLSSSPPFLPRLLDFRRTRAVRAFKSRRAHT